MSREVTDKQAIQKILLKHFWINDSKGCNCDFMLDYDGAVEAIRRMTAQLRTENEGLKDCLLTRDYAIKEFKRERDEAVEQLMRYGTKQGAGKGKGQPGGGRRNRNTGGCKAGGPGYGRGSGRGRGKGRKV